MEENIIMFQVLSNGTVKTNDRGLYYNGGSTGIIEVGVNTNYMGLVEMICEELEIDVRISRLKIHLLPIIYPGGSEEFRLTDIRNDRHEKSLVGIAKRFGTTCPHHLFVEIKGSSAIGKCGVHRMPRIQETVQAPENM